MSEFLLVALLTLKACLASPLAAVCTCAIVRSADAAELVRRPAGRDAIFAATVLEVDRLTTGHLPQRVRFYVEASWRHVATDTVSLTVGTDSPCAFYTAGARYLVFATLHSDSQHLITDSCDEPWSLSQSATRELIAQLGKPSWITGVSGSRAIDTRAVRVGVTPRATPDSVALGISSDEQRSITLIEIADQRWAPNNQPALFRLPAGVYEVRVHWTDGRTSDTYVTARCEGDAPLRTCYVFRYLTSLRANLEGAG